MESCGLGILCCLRRYQQPRNPQPREVPQVQLDTGHMGNEVVIVKSGKRICGSGAALANAAILQNKCYFEMKIQSGGAWGVGLATKRCDLNKIPLGNNMESWVLRSDGSVAHNGIVRHRIREIPEEGDMIHAAEKDFHTDQVKKLMGQCGKACTYDHVELNFYHNGKHLHCPLTGMKGTVYPVFYVDDGSIIDVNFCDFVYHAPEGFQKIMFEKSLL
ncbi:SPRY domain-containing protein 7-like isoform X1 [Orbicella faveolata]|uniref:SPRY domain-containing protein 7-like isoform X1 n=1 Tax=Orbicella faveolata TaxID=48498 RepID=UPI0009E22135|nr:SPRY domain-containing protein 7-like isoform X1 [Orbicella faveolata]